jgi:hypothetical protein
VLPRIAQDLQVGVAGQVTSLVGSEIAASVLGRSLIARIGLTGGGFWSAVGRSGVTIAVGTVAWFAMDYIVDWILQLIGYGPEADLARNVEQALGRMQSQLIDGDPAAIAAYERLRQSESEALLIIPEDQQRFRQEADAIERSGALGLRREFQKLHDLQCKTRRAALLKMVSGPAGN